MDEITKQDSAPEPEPAQAAVADGKAEDGGLKVRALLITYCFVNVMLAWKLFRKQHPWQYAYYESQPSQPHCFCQPGTQTFAGLCFPKLSLFQVSFYAKKIGHAGVLLIKDTAQLSPQHAANGSDNERTQPGFP